MTDTTQALERALDHVPAIAMVNAERADWGMHTASACVAAGFSIIAVGADTPSAAHIVGSVSARPDMIVGLARTRSVQDAKEALESGATFLMSALSNAEVAQVAREAGVPWIAGALTPNEIERALNLGATFIQLYPIATSGGPLHVRLMSDLFPEADFVAGGGIGGDRLSAYFEAGARAVSLAEALYSRDLMASGDHMSIRNHAAAAHRDAAKHGRVHGEQA